MLKFILLDNYFPDLFTEVQIWYLLSFKFGLGSLFQKDKVNSGQNKIFFNNDQNECNISVSRLLRSKAYFYCSEIETKINKSSVKRSRENETGIIFIKSNIYAVFQPVLACDLSQIIILYPSYITQVSFTLNLFTKHIVIFKG